MDSKKYILVTGGAGYIGTHVCIALLDAGFEPVIIDDFSNSHKEILDGLTEICGTSVPCHIVDVADSHAVRKIFGQYSFAAVIHLAAKKVVDESVAQPLMYYQSNIQGLITVLSLMDEFAVKPFVYSSSATVYDPISITGFYDEGGALCPANPYGQTKLIGEQICRDVERTGKLIPAILRYFNPVGAHSSGLIGEYPKGKPGNLMPLLSEVVLGLRDHLTIFGEDFPTPDGTAIRDFIHVMDLAEAHVSALKKVIDTHEGFVVNIGTGRGYSVREIVETYKRVNNVDFLVKIGGRRGVDAANVCANVSAAKAKIGWEAKRNVEDMCRDQHRWLSNPKLAMFSEK